MKKEDKVEMLLDKFLEAETSLEEEKVLSDYFQNEDIKPEWLLYKDMFSYFDESKLVETQGNFTPEIRKTTSLFHRIQKYAAIIVIALIGTLFYHQQSNVSKNLGTYDDPEVALQETRKVFELISYHLNSSTEEMKYLQTLEETKTQYINKITP